MPVGAMRMALAALVAGLAALTVMATAGLGVRPFRALWRGLGRGFHSPERFRHGAEIGGQRRDVDLLARGPLDIAQKAALVGAAEGDRDAVGTGARGTADAVNILLGNFGQIVIDDVADARNVD